MRGRSGPPNAAEHAPGQAGCIGWQMTALDSTPTLCAVEIDRYGVDP
jgi:hypothetical protein